MTLTPDSPWLLPIVLAFAAMVGRGLTAIVMPLLEQLEAIFAAEATGSVGHKSATADQRTPRVAEHLSETAAITVSRPQRRGPLAAVPVLGWWLASEHRPAGWRLAMWLEVLAVVIGGFGWWWEVVCSMQLPPVFADAPAARALVAPRLFAHLTLCGFLAAATWCDLRYRVIPDVITVPGLLLGLAAVTIWPGILLPVGCVLPVEPASVLAVPDVLGLAGPLVSGGQAGWLVDLTSWLGLVLLASAFLLWWSVGTAAIPGRRWYRDPRSAVLAGGLSLIAGTWASAGTQPLHLLGLATAITGAVGAGGLIVFTREAASRALGKEAMGLGDATLMAMTGSWLGWQVGVMAFFIAAFLGLAHGLLGWLQRRETELAFGPSLCLATVLLLVGWRWIWAWLEPVFLYPLDLLIVLGMVVGLTGLTLAIWSRLRGA